MFSLAGPDSNGSRYLQGLDLFLELDDRGGSATTDHRLGRLVQEHRRFDEARKPLPASPRGYRAAGDHHGASAVATSLIRLLAKTGRHRRRRKLPPCDPLRPQLGYLILGSRTGSGQTLVQVLGESLPQSAARRC
ncbi:hypothetical protein ACFVYA_35975, partial [Amycolatopsis sp. NPDC058278]|uniref:hypothetical protein n=1 Tax=Amycolatopsis sp. NPDC058278 TaxID=3346417 RepID=UPI0036D7B562